MGFSTETIEMFIRRAQENISAAEACRLDEDGLEEESTNLEVALTLCDTVLYKDDSAEMYSVRATVYAAIGEQNLAAADAETACRLDPDCADYLVCLGEILVNLEKNDTAMDCFEEALVLEPGNIGANRNIGELYFNAADTEIARQYFATVAQSDPDLPDIEANTYLGLCHEFEGDVEDAKRTYVNVLAIAESIPYEDRGYVDYLNAAIAERHLLELGVDKGHVFEDEGIERKLIRCEEVDFASFYSEPSEQEPEQD